VKTAWGVLGLLTAESAEKNQKQPRRAQKTQIDQEFINRGARSPWDSLRREHRGFQSAWCSRQNLLPKRALSQIIAFVHQGIENALLVKLAKIGAKIED